MPAPLTSGFLHAALDALGPTGALAAVRDDDGITDFRWVYANAAMTDWLAIPVHLAEEDTLTVTVPGSVAEALIRAGRATVEHQGPRSAHLSWPVGPELVEADVRLSPFGDGVVLEVAATPSGRTPQGDEQDRRRARGGAAEAEEFAAAEAVAGGAVFSGDGDHERSGFSG